MLSVALLNQVFRKKIHCILHVFMCYLQRCWFKYFEKNPLYFICRYVLSVALLNQVFRKKSTVFYTSLCAICSAVDSSISKKNPLYFTCLYVLVVALLYQARIVESYWLHYSHFISLLSITFLTRAIYEIALRIHFPCSWNNTACSLRETKSMSFRNIMYVCNE